MYSYPVTISPLILGEFLLVTIFTLHDYYAPLHNLCVDMIKIVVIAAIAIMMELPLHILLVTEIARPIFYFVVSFRKNPDFTLAVAQYFLMTPTAKKQFTNTTYKLYSHAKTALETSVVGEFVAMSLKKSKKGKKVAIQIPEDDIPKMHQE